VECDSAREIALNEARCAVYYSGETRSVIGLASTGPMSGSRISRAATRVVFPRDAIEIVVDATPGAVAAWRAEPWS
jgi:hypothetical protein